MTRPQTTAPGPLPAPAPGPAPAAGAARSTTGTPPAVDLERLQRLLGTPELSWLIARVRRRMTRGERLTGTVSLSGATDAQRSAVQRLLGRAPRTGASLSVSLTAVDEVLRRSEISPDGLAAAVTALAGPVTTLCEARDEEERAWNAAFTPVATLCDTRPEFSPWYERLRGTGLVRRLVSDGPAAAAPLLADLAAVLSHLPTAPAQSLAAFAARICGDAHALDDDRPLATLALGAVRTVTGTPPGTGAEWRREAWAAAGLLKDDLSSTVLALGLPGDDTTPTGRAMAALRAAGQPAVLSLRQLVRDAPRHAATTVRVCENPTVVSAAADRLGPSCPPLVCTQGQPSAAAVALLRQLSGAGAVLLYHGDFDWGGLRIANFLRRRVPWRPWRYTAADYRAAAATARTTRLTGTPTTAEWDAELGPALVELGVRVEEELLLDTLLGDLADVSAPSGPADQADRTA